MTLTLALGWMPALAEDQEFTPTGMSGYATNALVRAYDASGFGTAMAPPFVLQSYVVQLDVGGDIFSVAFLGQTGRYYRTAWVNWKTGVIATTPAAAAKLLDNGPSDREEFLLPGIIAGEIISVYRYALSEGYISRSLESGAFNLGVSASVGGSGVGFLIRSQPQEIVSIKPVPTPTPTPGGMRCLSGGCNGWRGYRITVLNNHVAIRAELSL
jgi:hypothetical protein